MDRTRLRVHGVTRWTGLWAKWMVSGFFEGYMAYMRFDGIVAAAGEGKKGK